MGFVAVPRRAHYTTISMKGRTASHRKQCIVSCNEADPYIISKSRAIAHTVIAVTINLLARDALVARKDETERVRLGCAAWWVRGDVVSVGAVFHDHVIETCRLSPFDRTNATDAGWTTALISILVT